jgi:hypothetical protein
MIIILLLLCVKVMVAVARQTSSYLPSLVQFSFCAKIIQSASSD